jgi:phosphoglycolate phosphatase-like HAD superfamily hydrolase
MNLAVFGVDGTLLDNLASEDECFERALRGGLGLPVLSTNWELYEHVSDHGVAVEAYQRHFAALPSDEAIARTVDRFIHLLEQAHRAQPIRCVPGANGLLAMLRERGWAIALATGAWRRAAEFKLAAGGVNADGLPIATAEDGPARAAIVRSAILRAEQVYAATFARIVTVGDAVWDVHTAWALGLPFVGIAHGTRADRLRAVGARRVIPDFSAAGDVIEHFESAGTPLYAAP